VNPLYRQYYKVDRGRMIKEKIMIRVEMFVMADIIDNDSSRFCLLE